MLLDSEKFVVGEKKEGEGSGEKESKERSSGRKDVCRVSKKNMVVLPKNVNYGRVDATLKLLVFHGMGRDDTK